MCLNVLLGRSSFLIEDDDETETLSLIRVSLEVDAEETGTESVCDALDLFELLVNLLSLKNFISPLLLASLFW